MLHHRMVSVLVGVVVLGVAACGGEKPAVALPDGPPLIEKLGDHRMPISTSSPLAQKYFDQGLRLTYAFNHAEAIRAFEAGEKLDPECAMCAWGAALARGPNINAPMAESDVAPAVAAAARAQARAAKATPREQAYIAAVATRYSDAPDADRVTLDRAYADAMRALAKAHPDDLDAQTLAAEALMDLSPWDYWTKDSVPKAATPEIVALLENVLQRDPNHPGANHYYIHAVEASRDPGRALPSARKLESLAPSAGHLVHMSAHTYMRVGLYADASKANARGAAVDEEYFSWCRSGGLYPLAYYPHNLHFLWASQTMEGRSADAIATAKKLREKLPPESVVAFPLAEEQIPVPYYALLRFGRFDEMLVEPAPLEAQRYANGMWHYARGVAYAAKGQLDEARAEHARLDGIAADPGMQALVFPAGSAKQLLELASQVLTAEIAERAGDTAQALAALENAKGLEYALNYTEPPSWYFPVRQMQGAMLLASGRPAEAEVAFREDLEAQPENGWSLYGLVESLRAQDKASDDVEKRFAAAWTAADIKLEKPRF
jgi:tetratricopeptide (TPR) repeat protein